MTSAHHCRCSTCPSRHTQPPHPKVLLWTPPPGPLRTPFWPKNVPNSCSRAHSYPSSWASLAHTHTLSHAHAHAHTHTHTETTAGAKMLDTIPLEAASMPTICHQRALDYSIPPILPDLSSPLCILVQLQSPRVHRVVSTSCRSCGGRGSPWTLPCITNCSKSKAALGAPFLAWRVGDSMLTQKEAPSEFSPLEVLG